MRLYFKVAIFSASLMLGFGLYAYSAQAATCDSITPTSVTRTGLVGGGAMYTAVTNGYVGYMAVSIDYSSGVNYDSGYADAPYDWNHWQYYVNPQAYGTFVISFWPNGNKCKQTATFTRIQPTPPPPASISVSTNNQTANYQISRGYSDCSQAVIISSSGSRTFNNIVPDTYYICPAAVSGYTYTTSAGPGNQLLNSGGNLTFTITYNQNPTPTPTPPPPSCTGVTPSYYQVVGPGGQTYTAQGVQGASYVIVQINYAFQPGVPGDLYETGYATDRGGGSWSYYVNPTTDYEYVVSFFPQWVKCGQGEFVRKPLPPPPPGSISIVTNNQTAGYQFNRGQCEGGWSGRGTATYNQIPVDYYVLCTDPVPGYTVNVAANPTNATVKSNQTLTFTITYSAIPGSISVSGCLWPNWTTFNLKGPSCPGSSCPGTLNPGNSCSQNFSGLQPGTYTLSDVSNSNPNRYTTVIQPASIDLQPGGGGRFSISYPEKSLSAAITCDPRTVPYGGSSNVTWSSTAAESCQLDVHPPSQPHPAGANVPVSGSKNYGPLYSTQDFTLTCYGYSQ